MLPHGYTLRIYEVPGINSLFPSDATMMHTSFQLRPDGLEYSWPARLKLFICEDRVVPLYYNLGSLAWCEIRPDAQVLSEVREYKINKWAFPSP